MKALLEGKYSNKDLEGERGPRLKKDEDRGISSFS